MKYTSSQRTTLSASLKNMQSTNAIGMTWETIGCTLCTRKERGRKIVNGY